MEKLCKRNFQMNLEFIQWMKILHDTMVDPSDTSYNAEERLRAAGVKPLEATKIGAGGTGGGAKRAPAPPVAKKENVQPASRPAVGGASAKAAAVDTSGGKLAQAQLEITDLKLTVDGLEKVSAPRARFVHPPRHPYAARASAHAEQGERCRVAIAARRSATFTSASCATSRSSAKRTKTKACPFCRTCSPSSTRPKTTL